MKDRPYILLLFVVFVLVRIYRDYTNNGRAWRNYYYTTTKCVYRATKNEQEREREGTRKMKTETGLGYRSIHLPVAWHPVG